MNKHLPARPNLDHLKRQAKTILANAASDSASAFRELNLDPAIAKLADAQLVVARQYGFESWPKLVHTIETLNNLEGTWAFESLEVGGNSIPGSALTTSTLVINGDRFNMLSPEGDYLGVFKIRISEPNEIDIDFIEGPEAGNSCYGIFRLEGNKLTFCLGLVGADRPLEFSSTGSPNHALEVLRRVTSQAPVREAVAPDKVEAPVVETGNLADFQEMTPAMAELQGEWLPLEVVNSGQPLPQNFLAHGARKCEGTRTTVTFGGQKMVDVFARAHADGTIDYLVASGPKKDALQFGIYRFEDDVLVVCMAEPGMSRPSDFTSEPGSGHTLTRWRKKQ